MKAITIITKALENRTTNQKSILDVVLFVFNNPSLHKSIIENEDNYTDLIHDVRGLMTEDEFFVPRVLKKI
jgi:hypothetical protein